MEHKRPRRVHQCQRWIDRQSLAGAGGRPVHARHFFGPRCGHQFQPGWLLLRKQWRSFYQLGPRHLHGVRTLRVVDPGVSANFKLYYDGFNSSFTQTTAASVSSSAYTSASGAVTWTSAPFTINPGNVSFYSGFQLQVVIGGAAVTDAQIVIDSVSVSVIPEPASASLLGGVAAIGLIALRRRRPASTLSA